MYSPFCSSFLQFVKSQALLRKVLAAWNTSLVIMLHGGLYCHVRRKTSCFVLSRTIQGPSYSGHVDFPWWERAASSSQEWFLLQWTKRNQWCSLWLCFSPEMLAQGTRIHLGMLYITHSLPVFCRERMKIAERDGQDGFFKLRHWVATASQEFFGSLLESHFKAITHSELYSNTEINAST